MFRKRKLIKLLVDDRKLVIGSKEKVEPWKNAHRKHLALPQSDGNITEKEKQQIFKSEIE